MVIQCPECQTRFKLADEKVKPGGIKVRCAKCKDIFPVMPSPPPVEEDQVPAAATMQQDETPGEEKRSASLSSETGAKDEEPAKEDASEFFFGPKASPSEAPSASQQEPVPSPEAPSPVERDEHASDQPATFGFDDGTTAEPPESAPADEFGQDADPFGFVEESSEPALTTEPEQEPDAFAFGDSLAEDMPETSLAGDPEFEADAFGFDDTFAEETAVPPPSTETEQEPGDFAFGDEFAEDTPGLAQATGSEQDSEAFAFDNAFSEEEAEPALEVASGQGPEPLALDDAFSTGDTETELSQNNPAEEFSFGEESQADDLELTEAAPENAASEFSFAEGEDQATDEFAFEEEISFDDTAESPPFESDSVAGDEFAFDEDSEETSLSWETESSAGPVDELSPGEEAGDDDFDFSNMTFGEDETIAEPEVEAGDFASQTAEEYPAPATPAPRASAEPPSVEETSEAIEPPPAEAKTKRKGPLSGLTLLLLSLLLALLGAAGYFFWSGKSLDLNQLIGRLTGKQVGSATDGQIRLTGLTSVFITNKQAGQLFVIQGQAINDYPEPRSAVAVKGTLFDKDGNKLMQQTVFCGNPLKEDTLKNWPFSKIEESMNNQFGDSLSNLNIARGKAIPFSIVFKNLPPNLAEFVVEPADSKPGSKP